MKNDVQQVAIKVIDQTDTQQLAEFARVIFHIHWLDCVLQKGRNLGNSIMGVHRGVPSLECILHENVTLQPVLRWCVKAMLCWP